MNKSRPILPIILILTGVALMLTAVFFLIDINTSSEPATLGQSLRDWLTLITGLGTSIKGWIDLTKKEPAPENKRVVHTDVYIENQVNQESKTAEPNEPEFQLTSDQEHELLDKYLKEVERKTRRLPWGYILSRISPNLEISEIYVPPSFTPHEQRPTLVAQDEKQEKDQERSEKKNKAARASFVPPVKTDIHELLKDGSPVAVIGYMGTGKSLTANYIAWLLAKKMNLETMGFAHAKTPILIKLGDQAVLETTNLVDSMFEIAAGNFSGLEKKQVAHVLKRQWVAGSVVLILDALDEYTGKLETIKREIDNLVEKRIPGNHIILTTRPSAYRLVRPAGFKGFELDEIETGNIETYLRKWVSALLPHAEGSGDQVEKQVSHLKSQISGHRLVEDLMTNPLLLTILVALSLSEKGIDISQVKNETDLYQQYVHSIIERENLKAEDRDGPSPFMLQRVLGYVGLMVHVARTQLTPEFPNEPYLVERISETSHFSKEANRIQLVEAAIDFWKKAGLFTDHEELDQRIGFRHQAFQYYGAALGLSFVSEKNRNATLRKVTKDPQWFDVKRLFMGIKPASDFKPD